MSFPPAPWQLYGEGVQSLYLIDVAAARKFVPEDLEIVSIFGKTVGCFYLATYSASSTLQYHELIVAPALVRYRGEIGAWISHIYVDNPDSVAGGIDIWGLPKEMAEFTWSDSAQPRLPQRDIRVSQGDRSLCQMEIVSVGLSLVPWGKLAVGVDVFGGLEREILKFRGDCATGIKWAKCRPIVPTQSPLAALNLAKPLLSSWLSDLHLTANPPVLVGSSRSDLRQFQPILMR